MRVKTLQVLTIAAAGVIVTQGDRAQADTIVVTGQYLSFCEQYSWHQDCGGSGSGGTPGEWTEADAYFAGLASNMSGQITGLATSFKPPCPRSQDTSATYLAYAQQQCYNHVAEGVGALINIGAVRQAALMACQTQNGRFADAFVAPSPGSNCTA